MNCSCAICCSRLESSDDIFSTQCGHIFHFPCLTQWLERSKTCPQCREKTNASKIHRLYFNISNNETIKEDSSTLQERIDNLQFQILLRDKDVTDFKSKAATLKTQQSALRSEVLKLEAEIEHKNSAIHALKEQAKYYKQTHDEGLKYKEQAETLKNKLSQFKDVQTLLLTTNDEADELISATNDPTRLATYVSALKRELTVGLNSRKEYRMMIKQLKQDLNRTILENNTLKEKLSRMNCIEEVVQRLESENLSLNKRLDNIRKSQHCTEINSDDLLKKEPSKLPKKLPEISLSKFNINIPLENNSGDENEENSQNIRYRVQNLIPDNKRKMTRTNTASAVASSSILAKKPRLAHNPAASTGPRDETYASDGMGGFAKVEHFPKGTGGAIKKRSNSTAKSRSSNDINNQNKIDYFVDLTNETNFK